MELNPTRVHHEVDAALTPAEFYDRLAPYYESTMQVQRKAYLDAVDDEILALLAAEGTGLKVADIGCGDGTRQLDLAYGAPDVSWVGIDPSEGMVNHALKIGANARVGDICLPQPEVGLDAALILWNVLGHAIAGEPTARPLENVARMLRPGGVLILDVNNCLNVRAYGAMNVIRNAVTGRRSFKVGRDFDHTHLTTVTRLFSPAEIVRLCRDAGFGRVRVKFVDYDNGRPTHAFGGQIVLSCRRLP